MTRVMIYLFKHSNTRFTLRYKYNIVFQAFKCAMNAYKSYRKLLSTLIRVRTIQPCRVTDLSIEYVVLNVGPLHSVTTYSLRFP